METERFFGVLEAALYDVLAFTGVFDFFPAYVTLTCALGREGSPNDGRPNSSPERIGLLSGCPRVDLEMFLVVRLSVPSCLGLGGSSEDICVSVMFVKAVRDMKQEVSRSRVR